MYINKKIQFLRPPHLQNWLDKGEAVAYEFPQKDQFIKMLESLPWNPVSASGLDWQALKCTKINLRKLNLDETLDVANTTSFVNDTHIGFVYMGRVGHDGGTSDLGNIILVCEKRFGFDNIDCAYWGAPGRQWCIGLCEIKGELIPNFEHFFESDGMERIYIYQPH